jgi:hypothetical protein
VASHAQPLVTPCSNGVVLRDDVRCAKLLFAQDLRTLDSRLVTSLLPPHMSPHSKHKWNVACARLLQEIARNACSGLHDSFVGLYKVVRHVQANIVTCHADIACSDTHHVPDGGLASLLASETSLEGGGKQTNRQQQHGFNKCRANDVTMICSSRRRHQTGNSYFTNTPCLPGQLLDPILASKTIQPPLQNHAEQDTVQLACAWGRAAI